MSEFKTKKDGVTLIEMLVTMSIIVVVLIISLTVYNFWWKSYNFASKRAAIERELTFAMELIVKELRLAEEVILFESLPSESTRLATAMYIGCEESTRLTIWKGKNEKTYPTDAVIDEILFEIDDGQSNLLSITVSNYDGKVELTSKIAVLNKKLKPDPDTGATETSIAMYGKAAKLFK